MKNIMNFVKGILYEICKSTIHSEIYFTGQGLDKTIDITMSKEEFINLQAPTIISIFTKTPVYKFIKWGWGILIAVFTF